MTVVPEVDLSALLAQQINDQLFPPHLELVPQLNEVYELELAFLESRILSDSQLVRNGAYFARVGDRLTHHFLMCSGEPVFLPAHSSSRLRSFFQTNQFKTGYATHGLFPYRGKFHPQMVKALINIMGLKPGETVLDPMMGSGTVLIEATLMGIGSIGLDASPFCKFMAQAKLDGFAVPLDPIRQALDRSHAVHKYFRAFIGEPARGIKQRKVPQSQSLFEALEDEIEYAVNPRKSLPISGMDNPTVQRFLLLAYLDGAGYSERSGRVSSAEQFHSVLARYVFVVEKIQRVLAGMESELAPSKPLEGDARRITLDDESIDGILFSPPYSFAIDYLANDAFHLHALKVDIEGLRESMVGLRGASPREKYELYRSDMSRILGECARVLRSGRVCTIVVGTNNNQLSRILGTSPEDVQGIPEMLVEKAAAHGLRLVRRIERQITGMANTMRAEHILFLVKGR